jgi:hypothetical protein
LGDALAEVAAGNRADPILDGETIIRGGQRHDVEREKGREGEGGLANRRECRIRGD